MNNSLVSIILPCYNAEAFLQEALNSIIKQTYGNLEIIAINDGSADSTLNILKEYSKKDNRIVVVNNNKNLGLIETLNKGVKLTKGKYIARMDADDIAEVDRIQVQKTYLETHNLDLVSSGFTEINANGEITGHSFIKSTQPNSCLFQSFFSNPIAHPLLLIKSEVLKSNLYGGKNTEHTEDFELWNRLAVKGYKIGNIKKNLLKYRKTEFSISNKYEEVQIRNHNITSKKAINAYFGLEIKLQVISALNNRLTNNNKLTDILKAKNALKKMVKHFKSLDITNEEKKEINKVFLYQIIDISTQSILKYSLQLKIGGLILLISKTPSILFRGGLKYLINKL